MNSKIDFDISDSACKRIAFLISKKNNSNIKLRISVEGGGCAGFQYDYNFVEDEIAIDDIYIEKYQAKIIIDKISLDFIKGSILDFQEDLGGSFFQIKNPNAASGCGCGNSFSLK